MGIIDYLKDAAKLARELDKMDLYHHLLSAQEEVIDLRSELLRGKEENLELNSKLSVKESLVFENGVYWIRKDPMTQDNSATPVCPTCWDTRQCLVRLRLIATSSNSSVNCQNCKGHFILEQSDSEIADVMTPVDPYVEHINRLAFGEI